ncbi:MAG: hypothetical protein AB7R89_32125 [Dehalococcoidia bacterium]
MDLHPAAPAPITLPRSRLKTWLPLIIGAVLVAGVWFVIARENRGLWLAITNTSSEVVEVRINGDRLLIIKPAETQYLPVGAINWNSPQSIEVRRYPDGERLFLWRAGLTDLANNQWRLRVP